MKHKKKRGAPPGGASSAPVDFINRPFKELKRVAVPAAKPVPPPAPPPPPTAEIPDDHELFLRAMDGARRLEAAERQRVAAPPPASPPRELSDPEAEALAELSDLVSGNADFDVSQSDESIEGFVVGLDRRLLRRLRNGEFSYQAYIDLHRLTIDQAKVDLDAFLTRSFQAGKRCVLIIHGRGMNSKDQVPVLKNWTTTWLARGQRARLVLAFTSARPCDGGVGALYVLLRRKRDARQPIQITRGAKW